MAKRTSGRGPAYPFIDLGAAVEKARELYEYARLNPVPVQGAIEHWGYTPKSSSGIKTVAALKYYGLVEDKGKGQSKEVLLTDRAHRILVDHDDSPERNRALREAALAPKQFQHCWEHWGKDTPSMKAMRSYLIFSRGFVENTVDAFIKDYLETIEFAGLLDTEGEEEDETNGDSSVNIGDYIQWESQGVLQFPEPQKVRDISESGEFVFVEGSDTGIPLREVEVVTSESGDDEDDEKPAFIPPPLKQRENMHQETFVLDTGNVTIQWPSKINKESFEDFSDWLKILQRKIKRSIDQPESDDGETE